MGIKEDKQESTKSVEYDNRNKFKNNNLRIKRLKYFDNIKRHK